MIWIFLCLFFFSMPVFSQEIPQDLLKKMEETGNRKSPGDSVTFSSIDISTVLKNGYIRFTYGGSAKFKSLRIKGDTAVFRDPEWISYTIPASDISEITVEKRRRGRNALMGGGCGLVLGMFTGLFVYSEEDFITTLIDLLSSDEESNGPRLSKKAIPLIAGCTAGGALFGALVIHSKEDQQVVYRRQISLSFYPEIYDLPGKQPVYLVTARFRF